MIKLRNLFNRIFQSYLYLILTVYFNLFRSILFKKRFLITGCGRSGTRFTHFFLKKNGLKVGHEKFGKDGIVSHFHAPFHVFFRPVIHQVRHPIKVISSMTTFGDSSLRFIFKRVGNPKKKSGLYIAMFVWYYWNKYIERFADYRFRIEDLDKELPVLSKFLNYHLHHVELSKNINARYHTVYTWRDLEREDKELTKKIKSLALNYGYKKRR